MREKSTDPGCIAHVYTAKIPRSRGGEESCSLTRRRVLAGALLCLGSSLPLTDVVNIRARPLDGWLRALIHDMHSSAAIGRSYLHAQPHEGSAATLARQLFGLESIDELSREPPKLLKDRIRAARDVDFRNGDLVILEGWVFARTEARLLALAALFSPA